jgi:CO dehydrogenase maturation factor
MKVAVVGKGGSGKTTTSAVVARTLARSGLPTLALDCDTNPNLGLSLGLGEEATERLIGVRQAVDVGEEDHARSTAELVDRFGVEGPDGVRLVVVSAIENPEPGCPCCGISPERLLAGMSDVQGAVIADFEAGLGTVMRMGDQPVDVVVIVVEPTAKSLEVARRAADLVQQRQLGRVIVVANRTQDADDLARIRAALPGFEVMAVPDEPAIISAERRGESPLDSAPDAEGVRALVELGERLLEPPLSA